MKKYDPSVTARRLQSAVLKIEKIIQEEETMLPEGSCIILAMYEEKYNKWPHGERVALGAIVPQSSIDNLES